MKNFWTRFLSGLLYASLITMSIFFSDFSFKILISILSILVLKEYFNLTFIPRVGTGIGLTRLIKSMEKEGLI